MATVSNPSTLIQIVQAAAPEAVQAYFNLRSEVVAAGTLRPEAIEIILATQFSTQGLEDAFLTHARRALDFGATIDDLRHAVLVTLAAAAPMPRIGAALSWINDLEQERSA